jgi:broad-specificity NMP kinase
VCTFGGNVQYARSVSSSASLGKRAPDYPPSVKRVLLTGMSGTGKSSVIAALVARGYQAIDLDTHEWSEWVTVEGAAAEPGDVWGNRDWVWRERRVRDLLTRERDGPLFLSGTAANQSQFYPQLDHVILLSAPGHVIVERLETRTTNSYGKHPDELARVLGHIETVEPLLRRRATHEIDTSIPLDEVVDTILRLAGV